MEGNDFLFTWKPERDRLSYQELRALIDDFEAGRDVSENWTCASYRSIKKGDRAYVLKQGKGPCGIFAVAIVDGPAEKWPKVKRGRGKHYAPLKFKILLDPTKRMLVTKDELLRRNIAPAHRWDTEPSGVKLEPAAARAIDKKVARESVRIGCAPVPDDRALDDLIRNGQGRGLTGPERKLIEKEAMHRAELWLTEQGFEFENVSAGESCDFRAQRNGEEWVIEVKGTRGGPDSVLLTAKEVAVHRSCHPRNALLIVYGIVLSWDGTKVLRGGSLVPYAPWALDVNRLEPIGYKYRFS